MILVIGEALIDLIGKAGSNTYSSVVGGANANVALALARRNEPHAFFGRISIDGFGAQIRQHLSTNGVNLEHSIAASEQTSLAVATVGESGSASYSFYLKGTADWGWNANEFPSRETIESLGAVCIQYGCLTMAVEPGNLVVENWLKGLSQLTRSHDLNIRPSIGFSRERELERITRINQFSDIIKASDADLEWLFDLAQGSNVDDYAHGWSQGGKLVVITRGGAGVSLYQSGERIDVPAPRIKLVDTVGAGDTFMANLLAELSAAGGLGDGAMRLQGLSKKQLIEAARFAATAAALVCERVGCEPPTKQEVLQRLG